MKNAIFLGIALILFNINSRGQTFPPHITIDNSEYINSEPLTNVPLNGNFLYLGYFDKVYRMNLASPATVDYITDTGGPQILIGDFDENGILYFIDWWENDARLYSFDIVTDNLTYIGNLHGPDNAPFTTAVAMSYYGGVMYAIFSMSPFNVSASAVFSINLNNGLCTRISTATFPGFFVSLAIDPHGTFYGIDGEDGETGKLYQIDPNAGIRTLIGDTGLNTWTVCGADFNDYTGKLYYVHEYYGSFTINPATALPTLISGAAGNWCAVNSYPGAAVPFNWLFVLAAFVLIAGALVVRKLFF